MQRGSQSKTCSICKQNLSAFERIVAYRKNGTYVCHGCSHNLCVKAGMHPYEKISVLTLLVKLLFGVLFIGSASYHDTVGGAITAIAIGVGLIAWGVVPILLEKGRCDSVVANALLEKNHVEQTRHICKSCGGVGTGKYCEYCGAPFE